MESCNFRSLARARPKRHDAHESVVTRTRSATLIRCISRTCRNRSYAPGEAVLELDYAGTQPGRQIPGAGPIPVEAANAPRLGPRWNRHDNRPQAAQKATDELGSSAGRQLWKVGDRARNLDEVTLACIAWGTFAQQVAVPIENLIPIPKGWTDQQASCASLVYMTSYQAYTTWGDLPTSLVLVTGASGGVGVASSSSERRWATA